MKHLDFVNSLSQFGVSIRSTNIENKEKRIPIPSYFGKDRVVVIKNFNVEYDEPSAGFNRGALVEIISKAIDFDSWKHSWHNEIIPENYERFKNIIQEKILDRANQIDELLTVYFQLNHEVMNLEKSL